MSLASTIASERRENGRAIAIMCIRVLCFVANDAIAKWLTVHYTPIEIVFVRNLLALPMIVAIVIAAAGRASLRTRHLGVHALRGLFLAGGACTFFLALGSVGLAEATAVFFAAPIFIAALSVPLLGEHVGWRRWSAVIAGFAGVLVVVRPAPRRSSPLALRGIGAALRRGDACGPLARSRRKRLTMMLYAALSGSSPASSCSRNGRRRAVAPAGLPGHGRVGTPGFLTSRARWPRRHVAPFDYTALIWATVLGWLFWSEIPGMWTYAGAAVIVASGIYIVIRETRTARL
jgi:drug/metabolite transporter (DMT)-like permease